MGLRDKYAYAIQTAKDLRMQGSADERDGKLHFHGTVGTQAEANKIWDAIKTIPDWTTEVVADIKATGASAAGAGQTYTVKPGDTLSKIAKELLGDATAYMTIFNANKDQLSDPDKIKPGQVLKVPGRRRITNRQTTESAQRGCERRARISRKRGRRSDGATLAVIHAAAERLDALRRRPRRESIRHQASGGHFLEPVVADSRRGAQRFLRIAGFELDVSRLEAAAFRSRMAPKTGQAISLQFEGDRRAVGADGRAARCLVEAEQMLDMMAELVGDHVGFREIAGRPEPLRQLVEETQVEVDLAIAGPVERAGRRFRRAARRLDGIAKEHDARRLVAAAQRLGKRCLYVAGNGIDKIDLSLLLRRALDRALRVGALRRAGLIQQRQKVGAGGPAQQAEDDDRTDSNWYRTPTRTAARVLDVAAISR